VSTAYFFEPPCSPRVLIGYCVGLLIDAVEKAYVCVKIDDDDERHSVSQSSSRDVVFVYFTGAIAVYRITRCNRLNVNTEVREDKFSFLRMKLYCSDESSIALHVFVHDICR